MKAIFLISRYSFDVFPSTKYVARVYGHPTNPSTAVSGVTSSLQRPQRLGHERRRRRLGSMRCIFFTSSQLRIGVTTGPTFSSMSKSTPHPGQRRQNVAEEDAPVRLGSSATAATRHLHGHVGNFATAPGTSGTSCTGRGIP